MTRSHSPLSSATTSRALARSAKAVKSRMSRNRTVTSTSSPSSTAPSRSTFSATSGSTYEPNASRSASRSCSPATAALNDWASSPVSSADTTGTRTERSPWPTRWVAARRSWMGPRIERVSRSVR